MPYKPETYDLKRRAGYVRTWMEVLKAVDEDEPVQIYVPVGPRNLAHKHRHQFHRVRAALRIQQNISDLDIFRISVTRRKEEWGLLFKEEVLYENPDFTLIVEAAKDALDK
jgi:hypothetical protein